MRRRIDIAASLVVRPELLFLDEPTTGLDPRSRNQVWEIVRALAVAGHHRPADHPVPRRSGPAGRPDRGDRPRQGRRRGAPGPSSRPLRVGDLEVGLSTGGIGPELGQVLGSPDERCQVGQIRSCRPRGVEDLIAIGRRELQRSGIEWWRFRPRPAQPGRRLPRPHRPPRCGPDRGGAGHMTTTPCRRHLDPTLRSALAGGPATAGVSAIGIADLRLSCATQAQTRTRANHRRDRDPGALHAAVHLSLRRRPVRIDPRLPAVPAARHPGHGGAARNRVQRARPQTDLDRGVLYGSAPCPSGDRP